MIETLFELYRTNQITPHQFFMVCKHFKSETETHDMSKSKIITFPEEFLPVIEKINLYNIQFNKNEKH